MLGGRIIWNSFKGYISSDFQNKMFNKLFYSKLIFEIKVFLLFLGGLDSNSLIIYFILEIKLSIVEVAIKSLTQFRNKTHV